MILWGFIQVKGQISLNEFLLLVKEQNQELVTARQQYESEIAEAKTNLTPNNPEIEFGYMKGSPSNIGNRTDFSVSQEFEFPTSYIHKNKLKNTKSLLAGFKLKIKEQEVLLDSKKSWIQYVSIKQQLNILNKRKEILEELASQYSEMYNTGEINRLDYNKLKLKSTTLDIEYHQLINELNNKQLELNLACNSQTNIIPDELEIPDSERLNLDTLIADYKLDPELQYYRLNIGIKEKEKNLTASNRLPKFMAGYYSESILNEQLYGIKAGLTIPLWENAGKVNKAKQEILFANSEYNNKQIILNNDLRKKHSSYENLKTQITILSLQLDECLSDELLLKALNLGEIDLTEYFMDSELYYQSKLLLISLNKEKLLLEADLKRIYF